MTSPRTQEARSCTAAISSPAVSPSDAPCLSERPHLLLYPGIAVESGEVFRPGDSLLLKRPDGSMVNARIGGFLEVSYNRTCQGVTHWVTYDSCIAMPDLDRDEVPPGTEVWSVDPP